MNTVSGSPDYFVIYYEGDDVSGFTLGEDIPIAKIKVLGKSGISSGSITLSGAGDIAILSGSDGTVTIGLSKWGSNAVYKSIVVDVDIP